jgi:putative glutamine amidotransferase
MTIKIAVVAQLNQTKYNEVHTSLDNAWFELLAEFDCSIHILPNHFYSAKKLLDTVKPDAFILTGGGNFSLNFDTDPRSQLEAFILTNYTHRPILGVCRGMQAMHIFSGGELEAVSDHVRTNYPIVFNGISTTQNSFHNYGFKHCTDDYIPLSISNDNVIKAFRHKHFNWMGIMWHPERFNSDNRFNINLIKNLIFKAKQ